MSMFTTLAVESSPSMQASSVDGSRRVIAAEEQTKRVEAPNGDFVTRERVSSRTCALLIAQPDVPAHYTARRCNSPFFLN
jgi:hypothetical protein